MKKQGLSPSDHHLSILRKYRDAKTKVDIETVSGTIYPSAEIFYVQSQDETIEEEHDLSSDSIWCFHLNHVHAIYIWFKFKTTIEECGVTEEIIKELQKVPIEFIHNITPSIPS